jgi:hypothetical protein
MSALQGSVGEGVHWIGDAPADQLLQMFEGVYDPVCLAASDVWSVFERPDKTLFSSMPPTAEVANSDVSSTKAS